MTILQNSDVPLEHSNLTTEKFIFLAPWKVIPNEPRHNNWHYSLYSEAPSLIQYIGIIDKSTPRWIAPFFPLNQINRRLSYLSVRKILTLRGVIRKSIRRCENQSTCKASLVIFEGNLFWAYLLAFLTFVLSDTRALCNLWPSSKYHTLITQKGLKSLFLRINLAILSRCSNLQLAFDTKQLVDFVEEVIDQKFRPFPVPSSFGYRFENRTQVIHKRVLVLCRNYNLNKLFLNLRYSCPKCEFHFEGGAIEKFFLDLNSVATNIRFNREAVPIESYEKYIDSFDHCILLYKPIAENSGQFSSFCASGKLLDVLLKRIPVSLPSAGIEWVSIASEWGEYHKYDWFDDSSINLAFNHPKFSGKWSEIEPTFTPKRSLEEIDRILWDQSENLDGVKTNSHSHFKFLTICVLLIYSILGGIINLTASSYNFVQKLGYVLKRSITS